MKENKIIKSATDRQMPDFEAIREKCVNQEKPEKAKIYSLRPTRLLAVAAIAVLAIAGTIAVVANSDAIFSIPFVRIQTSSVAETQKPTKPKKHTSSESGYNSSYDSDYYSSYNSSKTSSESKVSKAEPKETISEKEKRYISYLNDSGYEVTTLSYLGKVGDYRICYAYGGEYEPCNYDYILGDYCFTSTRRFAPYSLGLYAVNMDLCCTLGQAYEYKLFKNFGDVIELIENYDGDCELDFYVGPKDEAQTAFIDYFGDHHPLEFASLGSTDDFELYYDLRNNFNGEGGYDVIYDGLAFTVIDAHNTYDIGLFIYKEGQIYTLANAVNKGQIDDLSVVKELLTSEENLNVPFSFTIKETAENTTEDAEENVTE